MVPVGFRRGEGENVDPFVGTATITITLEYGPCLRAFYATHPELAQDQPDGGEVFARWLDDGASPLCSRSLASGHRASCRVLDIRQSLGARPHLTVSFRLLDGLDGRALPIGPIPGHEASRCADEPWGATMQLDDPADLDPRDVDGDPAWEVEGIETAAAAVGTLGAIVVHGRALAPE